jgi:hypothetical protein
LTLFVEQVGEGLMNLCLLRPFASQIRLPEPVSGELQKKVFLTGRSILWMKT